MNKMKHDRVSRDMMYRQYCILYEKLTNIGYKGRFGQNALTLGNDEGVSSYLKYRMATSVPYKGFGVSAQSMSPEGISYNSLKNQSDNSLPEINSIGNEYTYLLPAEELAAKFISISLYSAKFDLKVCSTILGTNALDYYKEELTYLTSKEFIHIVDSVAYLTKTGVRFYAAVGALFWSKNHKKNFIQEKA